MNILHPMWLHSAIQLEVQVGQEWCPRGTGVVIRFANRHFLATARHVVDERYAKGPVGRAPFEKIRILDPTFFAIGTDSQEYVEWDADWKVDSGENDLALTPMPESKSGFYRAIDAESILEKKKLEELQLGQPSIMSGFPALGDIDANEPLLVGRQGVLASLPARKISIPETLGSDYFLFDSFAQSGFSGAPLFSFERPEFSIPSPVRIGNLTVNGEKVSEGGEPERHSYPRIPAGLAGIVCGHFKSAMDRSDGGHAGLSYCVPAHRIIELIKLA